jgi:hypothetical protein
MIITGFFLLSNGVKGYDEDKPWAVEKKYRASIQRQNDTHSCAFFTCWYFYQLVTGGSIEPWEGDWDSKTASISEDIMVSLVNHKLFLNIIWRYRW